MAGSLSFKFLVKLYFSVKVYVIYAKPSQKGQKLLFKPLKK